jgi:serine kinase of HPr protein (carbohydrate metabolism regulator)
MIVHAGLIAMLRDTRWRGILLRGASGTGKSDLALRALDRGFRLVADDRVVVFSTRGRIFGRAPGGLRDLAEIRGLGVVPTGSLRLAEVALIVDCVASGKIERMPEPRRSVLLCAEIPTITIRSFEASAPAKLCRALERLGTGGQQDYDPAFP